MKLAIVLLGLISMTTLAAPNANYEIKPGKLHREGQVKVIVLPETKVYKVQMDYKVKKKSMVPVPQSKLEGKKVMDFPNEFRTEAGYKKLEKTGRLEIPKAVLHFVKREDIGNLKGVYVVEVKPTNKKSKILIKYHPSLPATGWHEVKITFLSPFPILDGYQLVAHLK